MGVIRVLVTEDQALTQQSFVQPVDAHPQMKIIDAVDDGTEAVCLVPGADMIVMDVCIPVMNGTEAARQIVQGTLSGSATRASSPKILVLITLREENLVLGVLEAGIAGFLFKDSDPRGLPSAIMRIHRDEGVIDLEMMPMMLRHVSLYTPHSGRSASASSARGAGSDPTDVGTQFMPYEQEILNLVCQGLSDDEVAHRLVVVTATMKTHVKAPLTKTGSHSRVSFVI